MDSQKRQRLLDWIGALAVAVTSAASWKVANENGMDFGLVYVTAVGVAKGAPLYDSSWHQAALTSWHNQFWKNVPYPPSTGFITLPLAAFSLPLARTIWFLVMTGAVIAGVRGLIHLALPKSRPSVWLFVSAAVLSSACMRWGFAPLQCAPLVFALLAALLFSLQTNRPRMAFFAITSAMALKFTVAIPFVALLILYKHYRILFGSIICVLALNVIGFARVGGWTAVSQYRDGIQGHEVFGSVDSPDPWDPASFSRVDWSYMLNGLFGYHESFKFVAIVACGWIALWLYWRSLGLKRPVSLEISVAFLAPITCLGLLFAYHHSYDCSALYVPLIVMLAMRIQGGLFYNNLAWLFITPAAAIMAFLPWIKVLTLADNVTILGGRGVINMIFPITITFMLCGTLLFVRDLRGQFLRTSLLPASI